MPKAWHVVKMDLVPTRHVVRMVFGECPRWQHTRSFRVRRCAASNKLLWPGQKRWVGVVAKPNAKSVEDYFFVHLSNDYYLISQLKGEI